MIPWAAVAVLAVVAATMPLPKRRVKIPVVAPAAAPVKVPVKVSESKNFWAMQCPSRGAALRHGHSRSCHQDHTPIHLSDQCCHCGVRESEWVKAGMPEFEPEEPPKPGERRAAPTIPAVYKADFLRLMREGFTAQDAQALIAHREGLEMGEGQKRPWTLQELARLEFIKAIADRYPG